MSRVTTTVAEWESYEEVGAFLGRKEVDSPEVRSVHGPKAWHCEVN